MNKRQETLAKTHRLADDLDEYITDTPQAHYVLGMAAAMLRHQADRIAELEKELAKIRGEG